MIGPRLRVLLPLLLAMTPDLSFAADLPRMYLPSLSPDARYVAFRSTDDAPGGGMALDLLDLSRDDARRRLLEPAEAGTLDWCMWGNAERLVCSQVDAGGATRLIAVDAAGGGIAKVLVANADSGRDPARRPIVVDGLSSEPRHLLIRLYAPGAAWPSVHRFDIYEGTLEERVAAQAPIRDFVTDPWGEVRFGMGEESPGRFAGFARLGKARLWKKLEWKRLSRFPPSPPPTGLWPMPGEVVMSDIATVLARTDQGDTAWKVDLTDRSAPEPGSYTGRQLPIVSPMNERLGMEYPGRDGLEFHWFGSGDRVLELIAEQRPGAQDRIVDYVMNPSSYLVESRRGTREPAKVLLFASNTSGYGVRELGVLTPPAAASVAAAAAGTGRAKVPTPASPAVSGEELDLLLTLTDPDGKVISGLPMRVVLSSDPDRRAADAGKHYVTDAKGRVRDSLRVNMESRRVSLDIPLVTHKARGFELGIEIEMSGLPLLYTVTLDEVKKSTLISNRQAFTRDAQGAFTREVDLDWAALSSNEGDVYTLPPREPKTFERLPDPPPSRLSLRNLQMLSHPRADGSKRWTLELRLTLDPYRPRRGG